MAHIEGCELASEIVQHPLGISRIVELVTQIAQGLGEATAKAIVHRDVKPANVMVTKTGHAIVMDFGLAQLVSAGSKLTKEGTSMGTAAYMSPE